MEIPKQPWALGVNEVIESLKTAVTGLHIKKAEERLIHYGYNEFHGHEKVNAVSIFLKQFASPLVFLLLAAGFFTAILGEWIDTLGIIFATLLNLILGFYHEYHAENTLDKLTTYIKDRTRVIRDNKEEEIDSSLVVPGDILKLSYGSRIPADARIITTNNFWTDEAILTGESAPIEKNENTLAKDLLVTEHKNIAHAGTLVVQGYATAVVYATGDDTEIGKIANIVSGTKRAKTPLQKGVDKLAWLIFLVVILIVVGIFVLGILKGEPLLPMLVLSAAVAVGAVPEALPVALTVILAVGAERIASKKGIVRKLTAAETLGSTTLIMTDKTGTLTLADMQLVGIHSAESILYLKKHQTEKTFSHEQKVLLELALLNIDVSVENPNDPLAQWTFRGRPLEVNIAKACLLHNVPLDSISVTSSHLVLPFNSTNKFSIAENEKEYVVMGAPDILLKKAKMAREEFLQLESWIEETSREGNRLIGLGSFPKKNKNKKHFLTGDIAEINFLGIFAFHDPIRPEVPAAIKNIESHGIKIVLVTGDLVGTALSLSKDLGWGVEENTVITGVAMQSMTDTDLLALLPQTKIFARVTPEDKLRIGLLYQKLGEVVAMTGDGVNDAPALKAMDIGISIGSGSDVAKSAADLVLLNDNFQTINLAIDEGRRILSNIRKMFVYLMSNSLDDVFVVGGSLIFGLPMPLTALQIIWVNLFTGSLPALALAFDEDMDKEHYKGSEARIIFTKEVQILTFGVGLVSSLLVFALYYFLVHSSLPLPFARSIFFVCFSSYVLAVAFSFRSLHRSIFSYSIFSNKKLNISILISFALLILTISLPFMRDLFSLAPLPLVAIPFVFFWILLNIFIIEIAKYFLRQKNLSKFKEFYVK